MHFSFEAHMYAAECLIHLNRHREALNHLNPNNFTHLKQYQNEMKQHSDNDNDNPNNALTNLVLPKTPFLSNFPKYNGGCL